jgi:hypothetical protein
MLLAAIMNATAAQIAFMQCLVVVFLTDDIHFVVANELAEQENCRTRFFHADCRFWLTARSPARNCATFSGCLNCTAEIESEN